MQELEQAVPPEASTPVQRAPTAQDTHLVKISEAEGAQCPLGGRDASSPWVRKLPTILVLVVAFSGAGYLLLVEGNIPSALLFAAMGIFLAGRLCGVMGGG